MITVNTFYTYSLKIISFLITPFSSNHFVYYNVVEGCDFMVFGDRLRTERLIKGLTQEELGKLINKTKNGISQYETGKREPDLHTLNRFAEIFDCTIDYLLGRTDKKEIVDSSDTEFPQELKEVGIEYLEVSKELKDKGFTPEKIRNLIKSIEALNEK